MRKFLIVLLVLVVVLALWSGITRYVPHAVSLLHPPSFQLGTSNQQVRVVSEESVTIDIVKKTGPSVVTVIARSPVDTQNSQSYNFGPFSLFGLPNQNPSDQNQQPQAIGSGFVVSTDGLLVTNKHVVADTSLKYQVITADNKKYDVQKIYRDPLSDVAILKIDPMQNVTTKLKPVILGDSTNLQVGQFVVAIGTALGEFRNTVTTGVVSGLGRGITAGDQFQGFTEKLDNVIQTSAAINPGNSGGPLLNSSGQVIGVDTAVAQSGQNIGFALPVNVIKESLNTFNTTGQFNRPYLGVAYTSITKDVALLNDVPQGAYVQQVEPDSPADKVGVVQGDIIVKFDGKSLNSDLSLAAAIGQKKVGDSVEILVWRNNKTLTLQVSLESAPSQ